MIELARKQDVLISIFHYKLKTKHLITAHPAMPIGSTYKFETVNLSFHSNRSAYHLIYSDVVYFGNLMDRADKLILNRQQLGRSS